MRLSSILIAIAVSAHLLLNRDRTPTRRGQTDTAAQDNLHAVESFYQKFPELVGNGLYITGESYAGVYVPTLAEAILWAAGNNTYTGVSGAAKVSSPGVGMRRSSN